MDTYTELRDQAQARRDLNCALREMLVDGLDLPLPAELIDDDQPLFGRGLELDSLDTLEIVSLVEEQYDVSITDDDRLVFGSVNRLADYIIEQSGGIPERAAP